jgi:hypothetical protein
VPAPQEKDFGLPVCPDDILFYPELANMALEEIDDVFTAVIDPIQAVRNTQKRKVMRPTNDEAVMTEKTTPFDGSEASVDQLK